MNELKIGQKINLEYGNQAEIIERLGSGGQGIVYKVRLNDKYYALKWYYFNKIKEPEKFRDNLAQNISDGSPNNMFLWPQYLTEFQEGSFGYIMELREKRFSSFSDVLNARVRFADLEAIVNAALNIVSAFRALHGVGKSYQDLNDGGFFVDVSNGDIVVCDCDNVAADLSNFGIAGKPGYMAPEIVRGIAKPSVQTDKYSLAVILFKLFFRSDPLEGEKVLKSVCLTEEAEKKHYGSEAVFIYDPVNTANRPVRGVHNNAIKFWPIFPQYIREAFIASFTEGLHKSEKRIIESQWQNLLVRLRGEIITCACGYQQFLSDFERDKDNKIICGRCGTKYILPLGFVANKKYPVVLFPGVKLYKCHCEVGSADNRTVMGEVVENKMKKGLWGIKNLSADVWSIHLPNGTERKVGKNEVIPIFKEVEIDFGDGNICRIS